MKDKILQKLKEGDERTFELFYRRYKKPLYSFIYKRVIKKEVADEILNKTFFDFFEALRDFKGKSSLKTFLFSIAKHKIIDYYRKKKLKEVFISKIPESVVLGLKVFLDEEIERKGLEQKIKKAFNLLPNDYSKILRLKYIEGWKVKEIAKEFKMKFKATESLLFRARKAFIKVFKKL